MPKTADSGDTHSSGLRGYWKDWLPPMMRDWARQFARINNAGCMMRNEDGTESWHYDGWPAATILGKIKIEAEGAGQGSSSQRFAEVYSGNGRIIWIAMQGLPYEARQLIVVKYLSQTPWREAVKMLGLSRTAYWSCHNEAHMYIAARVPLVRTDVEMA